MIKDLALAIPTYQLVTLGIVHNIGKICKHMIMAR